MAMVFLINKPGSVFHKVKDEAEETFDHQTRPNVEAHDFHIC